MVKRIQFSRYIKMSGGNLFFRGDSAAWRHALEMTISPLVPRVKRCMEGKRKKVRLNRKMRGRGRVGKKREILWSGLSGQLTHMGEC